MDNQTSEFIPVGIELCPNCGGQNLSWCCACVWCGHDFIDGDSVDVVQFHENKVGAA
jgi:hypothetical protein